MRAARHAHRGDEGAGVRAGPGLLALALIFVVGGISHLVNPGLYRSIMPPMLPAHDALILVSGIAEIAGGVGILIPRTRRTAGLGLILLLVAVFPANVEMLRVYRAGGVPWWGEMLLWLRLPLQPLLIWWTWRLTAARSGTRWPPPSPI